MMFCHKLYIIECINLIINKETHLLLTVGNKIVTKNEEIRLVVGLRCKGNKSPPIIKIKLAKRETFFFFSPASILLSTQTGLVRFGYLYKAIN